MVQHTNALVTSTREKGWARTEKQVAVVEVTGEGVIIRTGRICSTATSHSDIDNIRDVVVWFDDPWRDADNADDAYEKAFLVLDMHLLGEDEVGLLRYPTLAKIWFNDQYSEQVLARINEAAKSVCFSDPWGRLAELTGA